MRKRDVIRNLKKWVAALRSGDYEQCFGSLRKTETKFCASGVACDVIDNSSWIMHGNKYMFDGYAVGQMPLRILDHFTASDDVIERLKTIQRLNDAVYSFNYVAAYI